MDTDYAKHLEFIRQLRELGAVKVSMGDMTVEFGPSYLGAVAPTQDMPEGVLDLDRLAELEAKALERLQYYSSENAEG